MTKKQWWVIFTLLMMSLSLFGCGNSTLDGGDNGNTQVNEFTVFTEIDGLANDNVTDILVDLIDKGVWFATWNGVSFYSTVDSTWTTFGAQDDIPNMRTTSLALDYMTATIWVGTISGPTAFDGTLFISLAEMDSLVNRYVTSILAQPDGTLWFGTHSGVSKYSQYLSQKWKSYTMFSGLAGDDVASVAVNATGDIWIGTSNGISVLHGSTLTTYDTVLPSVIVRVIYRASDGTMWCGTASSMAAYNGQSWKIYGTADGVPSTGINDFTEDRNRTLWVATDGGVAWFNGEKWVKLDLPSQLASSPVMALAANLADGTLWIGTQNGVVKYKKASSQ